MEGQLFKEIPPMNLRYTKIVKSPTLLLRLFGIKPEEFKMIIQKLEPVWRKKVLGGYKRPGRNFALSLEDMTLMLLLYYRSYMTQMFVGFLFGIDDSRVCRIIQKLEPLLAEIVAIPKEKRLSKKEVEDILIDATEQQIERPKRGQKKYYSGKKKRHTLKTEIRTTLKGKITHVSTSRPGSTHDFNLHKQEQPIDRRQRVYVDSGYQGLDKRHLKTELPYKATKIKPLDREEKEYNRCLSRIRVKIENVFAEMKVFRILSDRYRNKRKRYNIKFKVIAGIVNLKNGFMTA
jgi:DDE superfamily endonuclease/Helix-turn-helix of DDE superfamily endonuclease